MHAYNFTYETTLLAAVLLGSGCVVERIDRLLEERGVTWDETTIDTSETVPASDTTTSSTSTGSTSGTDTTTPGADGSMSAEGLSGGETSTGLDTGEPVPGSSTTVGPVCGDGVVDADETCDDMNDVADDGCNNVCARDSIVFVSSKVYDGAVNGLDGADQRCRMLAAQARLLRFETYRAWLSTATSAAADRLLHSRGRYVLVNGLVVAQDWDGLTSGTLEHPIIVDEMSQTQDYGAWTGTLADGQPALGSDFCDDWTSDSGDLYGGVGFTGMLDSTWSFFEDVNCSVDLHLYCIEQ